MNIKEVEIHGFGIWKNLQITELSDELTVFYGPNEAGKSTIMQFMRAMLYGFTPPRRARYLPPVNGGKGGGRVTLLHDHENWNVRRLDSHEAGLGAVALVGPEGREAGEEALKQLLCEVDESTYSNIYSLSLHELQELATLQETDAGRLLYEISAGLDRVSLGDVLRELNTSRGRMLSNGERPSQITELLAQRDRLQAEMEQLSASWRGRRRLSEERNDLERSVEAAQQEQKVLQDELRTAETAYSLRDLWSARAKLNEQLSGLGALENVPSDAIPRMDHAVAVLKKCRVRRRKLQKKRDAVRKQYAEITLNALLWKQAPRILALAEHEPWLAALEQQTRDANAQAAALEKKVAALRGQLGLTADAAPVAYESASRKLAGVLSVAKSLRQAAIYLKDARASVLNSRGTRDDSQIEIDELLAARGESSLTAALEKTGQLVSMYRRRLLLDDRLNQMARSKADLEFDLREYADLQMIPTWALIGLGTLFVFGAGLILAGILLSPQYTGGRNWPMVIFGVVAAGASTLIKSHLEHTSARKADACQKQLVLLQRQIEQAEDERNDLDAQIPEGAGTLHNRLDTAENDFVRLEELVPLESRRVNTHQESLTIRERLKQARVGYHKARKRWVASLAAAKLPENWGPRQVRDLARQYTDLSQIHKQWEVSHQEQERRLREVAALKTRVEQLYHDSGLKPDTNLLLEQIRQLRRELTAHETNAAEREELKQLGLKLRRRGKSYDRIIRKNEQQRDRLLRAVQAADENEFRERVEKFLQLSDLTRRRDNYAREIHAAIQGFCNEDDLFRWFKTGSRDSLETRLPELRTRVGSLQERLRQLFERRGALQQQAKAAVEDRRFAAKQLEINVVEQKLRDAVGRWSAFTVTHTVLDNLKTEYERNRQPETLREASDYLRRFTLGQYQRVWTPIGEQRLCVDDHNGHPVMVENLSRGTREQLFLSLRLALTSWYARRGKQLPLVLDDVLVNFDDTRAVAAAEVLRDFAREGHQMLLFTCHEHVGRIFQKLHVDVRKLPALEQPEVWPVFEAYEPETKYIEVIKPVEVIKEVQVIKEVYRDVEPAAAVAEPEPVAEEQGPQKLDPPRRRRRLREAAAELLKAVPAPEPLPSLPTMVVSTPPLYAELPAHFPQPMPQPAYIPEPMVVYQEPRLEPFRTPPQPRYVESPQVTKVYEQVFAPIQRAVPQPVMNVQPPAASVQRPMPQPNIAQPQPRPIAFALPPASQAEVIRRLDQPEQVVATWVPKRVRWNAEEFEGELDDQVRREQLRQERIARETSYTNGTAENATLETRRDTLGVANGYETIAGVREIYPTAVYDNGVVVYEQGRGVRTVAGK